MVALLVAVVGGLGKFLVGNALALIGFGELGPIAGKSIDLSTDIWM
jgi:hypothetical protein